MEVDPREKESAKVLVEEIATRAGKIIGSKQPRQKRALRNDLVELSPVEWIFRQVMSERTTTVSQEGLASVSPAFTGYLYGRAGHAEVKTSTAHARTVQTSTYSATETSRQGTTE